MKRLFTLLIAGAFPVFSSFAQLPVKVMGDMVVASGGTMTSTGSVTLNADATTNAKLVNKGTLNLKKGVTFVSTDEHDGILLNEGIVNFAGSVASDVKVIKTFVEDPNKNGTDYPLAFPFSMKFSEVTDIDGVKVYNTSDPNFIDVSVFFSKNYNADLRAQDKSGWQWVDEIGVDELPAEEATLFRLNPDLKLGKKTLIFYAASLNGIYKSKSSENHTKSLNLEFKSKGYTNPAHHGWAYLGSMQTTDYNLHVNHVKTTKSTVHSNWPFPLYYWDRTVYDWVDFDPEYDDVSMAPFTAFFTQIDSDQTITFLEEGRDKQASLHFRSSDNVLNLLQVQLENEKYSDRIRIFGKENYNNGYKLGEDAIKMFSSSETKSQIYIPIDGANIAASKVSSLQDEVPLGVKIKEAGEYSISIGVLEGEMFENQTVYLEDKKLGKLQNLKEGFYSFISDVLDTEDRFALRFAQDFTSTDKIESNILVYSNNKTLYIENVSEGDQVQVYDVAGSLVISEFVNSERVSYPLNTLGVYVVKITGSSSEVVKVMIK